MCVCVSVGMCEGMRVCVRVQDIGVHLSLKHACYDLSLFLELVCACERVSIQDRERVKVRERERERNICFKILILTDWAHSWCV